MNIPAQIVVKIWNLIGIKKKKKDRKQLEYYQSMDYNIG